MKTFTTSIAALVLALTSVPALAGHFGKGSTVTVEVTNLTNGIYFTPLLIAAHDRHVSLFEPGTPASSNLQAMAEGGDISGLTADVEAAGADYVTNPASGALAPGKSTIAELTIRGWTNRYLSVAGMLVPTNDGFVGLNAERIPFWPGTYSYYVNGYDAGTEANDEIVNGGGAPGTPGIPADPGGNNGTGATGLADTDHNQTVHIHRGIVGDDDPNGGPSDLDRSVHRWLNPIARVTVTVK